MLTGSQGSNPDQGSKNQHLVLQGSWSQPACSWADGGRAICCCAPYLLGPPGVMRKMSEINEEIGGDLSLGWSIIYSLWTSAAA